jgi:hypothetical protein
MATAAPVVARRNSGFMIDSLTILLTCGACIYFAFQAVRLDSLLPWFAPSARKQAPAADPVEDPSPSDTPARTGWRARATPPPER